MPPPSRLQVSTFSTALYIDPADQPPTYTTKVTYPFIWGTSLPAGGYFANSRTHVFTTTGCNHVVYAWADAGQKIAEDNEFNNVRLRHHLRRRPGRGRQLRARQHLRRLPLGYQHPGPLPPGPHPVAPGRRRLGQVQRRGRRQLHHPGHQPGDPRRPPALPSELVQQPGPVRHRAAHRLARAQQRALLHLGGRRVRQAGPPHRLLAHCQRRHQRTLRSLRARRHLHRRPRHQHRRLAADPLLPDRGRRRLGQVPHRRRRDLYRGGRQHRHRRQPQRGALRHLHRLLRRAHGPGYWCARRWRLPLPASSTAR